MFPYQDLVFFLGVKIIMEANFAMILPTVDANQRGQASVPSTILVAHQRSF
jgi:hypothetical protein